MSGLIDSPLNGATEIPGTEHDSMFVFLAGPIRYWWKPEVKDTIIHRYYMNARETIHNELSNWFLVYAPHRAWRGPWNHVAQSINDLAVNTCHAFVWLSVDGVTAEGTSEELAIAQARGVPCFELPVGLHVNLHTNVAHLMQDLSKVDKKRKENG